MSTFRFEKWMLIALAVVGAGGAALALTLALDMKTISSRNETVRGLGKEEVLERFYTALNTRELQTMLTCVDPAAVNMLNNRLIAIAYGETLALLTNYTHADNLSQTDGDLGTLTPAEWIARGKPRLGPGTRVFGIGSLDVAPSGDDRYRVSYELYLSPALRETGDGNLPGIHSYTDICSLKRKGEGWIIAKVDQVEGS